MASNYDVNSPPDVWDSPQRELFIYIVYISPEKHADMGYSCFQVSGKLTYLKLHVQITCNFTSSYL